MKRIITCFLCLFLAFISLAQSLDNTIRESVSAHDGELTTLKALIEDCNSGSFRIMATYTEIRDSLELIFAVEDAEYIVPVQLAHVDPDAVNRFYSLGLQRGDTLVIEGKLGPVYVSKDCYKGLVDAAIVEKRDAPNYLDDVLYSVNSPQIERPTFKGGDANDFSMWVDSQLVYPKIAKKNRIQGCVIVSFRIAEDGRVTDVKVHRSAYPALDEEAVRVVSKSPLWKPAYADGKPISVSYLFPVYFVLH